MINHYYFNGIQYVVVVLHYTSLDFKVLVSQSIIKMEKGYYNNKMLRAAVAK